MFPSAPTPPTRGFRYHFRHSTYVTAITDWFLGFFGKAAHLTLILTTLYTGAELLPGISLPEPVNNGVFIVQMLALDVGGMGLAKLAMQARDQGNTEGAEQADRLSKWLIRIVIASLVTVALEQAVRALPGLTSVSATVQGANIAIGGALTIARAICAVHYGRVMHQLQTTADEPPPLPVVEVEELVRKAVDDLSTVVLTDQRQAFSQIQQAIESHLPVINEEAIARTIGQHLEAMLRQCETQSQDRAPTQPEPQSQQGASISGREPEPAASASEQQLEARVSVAVAKRLQTVYDLLTEQGQRISGRVLAREAHINRKVATKWLTEFQGQRSKPDSGITTTTGDEIEILTQSQ